MMIFLIRKSTLFLLICGTLTRRKRVNIAFHTFWIDLRCVNICVLIGWLRLNTSNYIWMKPRLLFMLAFDWLLTFRNLMNDYESQKKDTFQLRLTRSLYYKTTKFLIKFAKNTLARRIIWSFLKKKIDLYIILSILDFDLVIGLIIDLWMLTYWFPIIQQTHQRMASIINKRRQHLYILQ